MGPFSRKSEFRKAVSPNDKFNVTSDPQLSLLREFLRNNYAYVILTAEADSLPTDEKELLDDYGLVDVIRAGAMTCQSTQELMHKN